jgi:hypothetical protein
LLFDVFLPDPVSSFWVRCFAAGPRHQQRGFNPDKKSPATSAAGLFLSSDVFTELKSFFPQRQAAVNSRIEKTSFRRATSTCRWGMPFRI